MTHRTPILRLNQKREGEPMLEQDSVTATGIDRAPSSIDVGPGLIAIIGNSGAGKSTLLRLLERAVQSRCHLTDDPRPMRRAPYWEIQSALLHSSAQGVVVTPQENMLVHPHLSTLDNVLHYLKTLPWDQKRLSRVLYDNGTKRRKDIVQRAEGALTAVGLGGREQLKRHASLLSGGEQRRLLLAMDLALGPKVLVADEPLSQLDSSSATKVFRVLRSQANEGPVLFTVHQPIDEWVRECDQVWVVEAESRVSAVVPGRSFVELALRGAKHSHNGQPSAYRVLQRLGEQTAVRTETLSGLRSTFPGVHRGEDYRVNSAVPQAEVHAEPAQPVAEQREEIAPSSVRFHNAIRHELNQQVVANLKSQLYWTMLALFLGVTFFTHFFGGANELPFSIPLATNALLVSVLFIGTMSGVRGWTGRAGDRIRQLVLRKLPLRQILAAKAVPAIAENLIISGLAGLGCILLLFRSGAGDAGWPDSFASVPYSWLRLLPTVVPAMFFVGVLGWCQGMVVSLWMAIRAQRSAIRHLGKLRNDGPKLRAESPRNFGDPVQQAYSIAVLMVVGQIGLGGAFGQITTKYGDDGLGASEFVTKVVDAMGTLSPLRWAYNWALVNEWREARCRVHETGVEAQNHCDELPITLTNFNRCLINRPQGRHFIDPTNKDKWKWETANPDTCAAGGPAATSSQSTTQGPKSADKPAPLYRELAVFYQAGGDEAERVGRIREKRRLLGERNSPLPLESVSQALAVKGWAKLNRVRLRGTHGGQDDARCMQLTANSKYQHSIAEQLVSKGMVRPTLVDVEWCWRACPDVRAIHGRNRSEYMLKHCPLPGESYGGQDDTMKLLHVPLVQSLFANEGDGYVCREVAHDWFKNSSLFEDQLQATCERRAISAREFNLLACMAIVALVWICLAGILVAWWGKRLRTDGQERST